MREEAAGNCRKGSWRSNSASGCFPGVRWQNFCNRAATFVDAGWLDGGRGALQQARSRDAIPPLAQIAIAPAGGHPSPRARSAEDGEAGTSISRDLAVGLDTPMLGVRIDTGPEVGKPTLPRNCQARPGESHALELPAIEIPALEVRTIAGVDQHRGVPAPTRGVQTNIA